MLRLVVELQLVPFPDVDGALPVEDFDAADILTDVARPAARIAAQCAADRSGDADQRFQSGQPMSGGLRDQGR